MELEGELEGEYEYELEGELEGEFEGEEFLGTTARGVGSLLGESEFEGEYELEGEFEGEYESEEFLRRIARGVVRFARRAAPVLRRVARVAVNLNTLFLLSIGAYLSIQALYSPGLKNIPIIDILIIAAGFILRVYAGAFVINAHLSV